MSVTTTGQSESSSFPLPAELSDLARKEMLREIADLTGEKYTVECRLQWINNRVDELRQRLATSRRHGNSKG